MNLRNFIERPILSSVISICIVVVGLISMFSLPVERFPDIAPPTIVVSTTYIGASAETIQKSVIAPLEEAINGVENMTYMTSSATNAGTASVSIYFKQGTDPDMAAVNVQNRVSKAMGKLPAEVTQIGVTTAKRQTSMLQVFTLFSPDDSYDLEFIGNYLDINIKPSVLRVTGVGEINALSGLYSIRIWMKPEVMAQYGLNPSDISAVLAEQNIEAATGSFGEDANETFKYSMKYKGRLVTPEEFGDMIIRSLENGSVLRLKDVADIELGLESYSFLSSTEGHPGVTCIVYQTPGSNATQVNDGINKVLEEARKDMPPGLELAQLMSANDFLDASMHEVIKTLYEAIILVILIVFIFLQDLRSTVIPMVGILVSLIGTFAFMAVIGFSLNLITLFALVLVIGTVVDDAIVVVEAVQAKFEEGYKNSLEASVDAMKEIGTAVISSSLVFMAVFIPVSFMSGTTGVFYKQFGLTMAVAVGFSVINALTLSPALCALMLRPHEEEHSGGKRSFKMRFRDWFNGVFEKLIDKYQAGVKFFMRNRWLSWGLVVFSCVVFVYLIATTKSSLVPEEDQGVLFVSVTTAPGSSVQTTQKIMNEIESLIADIPGIEMCGNVSGFGLQAGQGANNGTLIIKLAHWDERAEGGMDANGIIKKIYERTSSVKDASIFAMSPGMIPGYGLGNSLDLSLQDKSGGDINEFFGIAQNYMAQLRKYPQVSQVFTTFDVRFPQWLVEVDAAKCKRAGISPSAVLSTLGAYYGGQYVSNFNRFSKVYRVMLQAAPEYRTKEATLDNIFVKVGQEMSPLSQFVTLTKVYGAEGLNRFNMFNSISVSVTPAEGYSTGDAIAAVRAEAEKSLPRGYGYEFGGITREESQQSNTALVAIFMICILMIFLILSGLYESFILPFAVILSVPCGLMGSFIFARLFGLENNIYMQIGLIMLIGLLSKTAILMTEYAAERRRQGLSLEQAALEAAKARLRPILMTVLAMAFGMLPLMMSFGVGANGNRALSTGTVGGLIIGTIGLLFTVPVFFMFFQRLQEKVKPIPGVTNPEEDKKSADIKSMINSK